MRWPGTANACSPPRAPMIIWRSPFTTQPNWSRRSADCLFLLENPSGQKCPPPSALRGWRLFLRERADVSNQVGNLRIVQPGDGFHLARPLSDALLQVGVALRLHLFRPEVVHLHLEHLGDGLLALASGAVAGGTALRVHLLSGCRIPLPARKQWDNNCEQQDEP